MYTLLLIMTLNNTIAGRTIEIPAIEKVRDDYSTLDKCNDAGNDLRKSFIGTKFVVQHRCVK